jgi:geranylgeranyl diphosphate synthase type II
LKESIQSYTNIFEAGLKKFLEEETKVNAKLVPGSMNSLFEPVRYILSNGGKRIRPVLLLLTCEAYGGIVNDALDSAIAIEILHNFTLVHDDIMDNASTRRGRDTIHKKWDVNTAILVGDELIGLSYRSLLKSNTPRIPEVVKTFTDGVIEVCEGQALDKEFELSNSITIKDYFVMIRKKTAELLKTSAVIGAIIGGADGHELKAVRSFAENIGLAFQIQDDLLDVTANESKFGKKIGGDIIEKKKTYLYLKALEVLDGEDRKTFLQLFNSGETNPGITENIIGIYNRNCILESARSEIKEFTGRANEAIGQLNVKGSREILSGFSDMLLNRKY